MNVYGLIALFIFLGWSYCQYRWGPFFPKPPTDVKPGDGWVRKGTGR